MWGSARIQIWILLISLYSELIFKLMDMRKNSTFVKIGNTNHILLRMAETIVCYILVTEPNQMSCIQQRKDNCVGGYAQASLSSCFIIVTRKDHASILTAVTDLLVSDNVHNICECWKELGKG